jgi:uncharacterized membrane protein
VAVFAGALMFIVHWRYLIFRNEVDLGIFTQVIASAGSGFSSTAEGGINHLLVHWSPIIVLAWPFLRVFGPLGLEIFQALAIAATLVPVWALARTRFTSRAALAIVVVAALYPILCANGVGDFHEMAFVPVLSATFVYALDRRRWALGGLSAALLACTKEDQFVVLAFNGLVCTLLARGDREQRNFGIAIVALAVLGAGAYFGVVRVILQPHVAYSALHFFNWAQLGHLGLSFLGSRIGYALAILAPLAFLPCFSRYGLFLIPGFVEVMASVEPVTLVPGAHYSALLSGYALAAFVDGAARAASWRPRLAAAWVGAAALLSVGTAIFASPMEYWYYLYRVPNAHDALLERTLRRLPPNADAGSEDEIFAHLGLDRHASIDVHGQEWFVYDRTHYSDHWRFVDERAIADLVSRRVYTVVSDEDGIVVLHRRR